MDLQPPPKVRGRPRVTFQNASQSQKYQMARDLAQQVNYDVNYLSMALKVAKKQQKVIDDNPKCKECDNLKVHTIESGLSFFIESKFTKAQYKNLLRDQKNLNSSSKKPAYPSYNKINEAKKHCQVQFLKQSESEIIVDLQVMLDKTSERLIKALDIVKPVTSTEKLKLFCTVGMDSSSGYKNPNQGFADNENQEPGNSHQHLFVTSLSLVGLRNEQDSPIWTNPTPQSTRLCRPLRLAFEKETDQSTVEEYSRIKRSIDLLQPTEFSTVDGRTFFIEYDVQTTGMDQKCINAITGNRDTQKCTICNLSQRKYKGVDFQTIEPQNLQFGMSLLHCHIRCLEFLLALSYKAPFKMWRSVPKDRKLKNCFVFLSAASNFIGKIFLTIFFL